MIIAKKLRNDGGGKKTGFTEKWTGRGPDPRGRAKRQRWECPPYLYANDLLEKGAKRVKLVDGKPLLVDGRPVFVPVQVSDSGLRVRQAADGRLYFGNALPEFVQPPLALYNGTDYGREVQRRRAILSGLH